MDTQSILNELRAERDRLDTAIAALESSSNSFPTRRRRRMSAAGRKRLSMLLKRRWAQGKMGRRAKTT
jgi:hypothetical protein